jgi:hypothetical protein
MKVEKARLAINRSAKVDVVRIGSEPMQAALVCDDFYEDPEYVRDLALSLDYIDTRDAYPGYDATVSIDPRFVERAVNEWVDRPVALAEPYSKRLVFAMLHEDRFRTPRTPHADTNIPGSWIAAIVYLNLPSQCRGGTGFYRHRETGLVEIATDITRPVAEYMLRHKVPSVKECMARVWHTEHVPDLGQRPPFTTESNDIWELAQLVEMRFNRFVLYAGSLFHSPYVDPTWFGKTPETRRLTQNLFFVPRPQGST